MITTAARLAVAIAIVAFLIVSDRLALGPVLRLLASPGTCVALVALQLAILLLGVVRWWLILRAIEGQARSLSFAPVGFVVEALPLAPGGLGTVRGGASLFNAYYFTRMLVNLGGGVILVLTGRRHEER